MSRRAKTIATTQFAMALLGGTILAGVPAAALAQDAEQPAPQPPAPAAEPGGVIRTVEP